MIETRMPAASTRQRKLSSIAASIAAAAALAGVLALSRGLAAPATDAAPKDSGTSAQPKVDFARDVKPIFARRCFVCHGPDESESGLRLDRRETALSELDSGRRAVVPEKPQESELLRRISAKDEAERMPPEGKPLTREEVALIRRWIAEGAHWSAHWAFQPPRSQDVPRVRSREWVRTPIDAFILAKLEQNGLQPAPPAGKVALLRRATFDLTGLPPTPDQVEAFLADDSPQAFEKVVDRLLASDHYGERWARHWLDLVRFAETNSFERDGLKPNAWRYRDYVIRSLNADKPYDRFILEQLAGDELPDADAETIIATGYYRLGLWDDEPADPLQARYDELDDIITTTSQVFLGLTVNCARCHDHKIDPIPQRDYYRMLAFFHGLTPYGTRGDQRTFSQTDISPPDLAARYAELDRKKKAVREQMTEIEQQGIVKMSAEDQRKSEGPERKNLLAEKLERSLDAEEWKEYTRLKGRFEELEAVRLPPREMALSVARCDPTPPETHIFARGNPHAEGEPVAPGFPAIFGAPDPELPGVRAEARSSGRRTVLAKWIASPENMLTARVMVNRVWQHHFGRGIVRSSNNFGQLGDPPTHPELLDWLAHEFVKGGWRLKPMHRLIMLSSAYRMSSRGNPEALKKDPQNDLFWRFDMRRLSAEEIRDSMYAVSGRLNPRMYGPGFYPAISDEVMAGQSMPGAGWGKSSAEERARRSVYIHVKRSLITPLLASFDFPETDSSSEARFATTQPTQALGLMNGTFIHDRAREFAERLRHEAPGSVEAQVQLALRLALCREPDAESVERGRNMIHTLQKKHGLDADLALRYYCLVVLNLNEFLYLD